MGDLLTRLETAERGSRELSDEFLTRIGCVRNEWREPRGKIEGAWYSPTGEKYLYDPDPTQNLQDADDCIEGGVEYEISIVYGVARAEVGLNFADRESGRGEHKGGDVRLALCAAILRAKERG